MDKISKVCREQDPYYDPHDRECRNIFLHKDLVFLERFEGDEYEFLCAGCEKDFSVETEEEFKQVVARCSVFDSSSGQYLKD